MNATPDNTSQDLYEDLSPEELAQFETLMRENPREQRAFKRSEMSRRSFMRLVGASAALTGVGLTGCAVGPPDEIIVPYARMPEEIIPGIPLFFASAMNLGGFMTGLMIETHEGRPTRIEGNPNHPASLGGSDVFTQASILDLYNPERSTEARNDGVAATWEGFVEAVGGLDLGDGSGLRILTETVTSPTLASQLNDLVEQYPQARWYQYEPVARDNAIAGAEMAFGERVDTVYHFNEANVVVSLEADFMQGGFPGNLRYARDFMDGRRVRENTTEMNRLYVVESTPTLTGVAADHRLSVKSVRVEDFARALAGALGVNIAQSSGSAEWDAVLFDSVVNDLRDNAGSSIVIAGYGQPPIVHALAHAINVELGNVGNTVDYVPSIAANPVLVSEEIASLTQEMQAGDVEALFILGGNPAFSAPSELEFAAAMENVAFSAHLSLYFNETSLVSTWHLPATHFIEAWSDGRAYDGSLSIVQPPIGPLYDTVHSEHEVLALLLGDDRRPYDIILENWQSLFEGSEEEFELYWRRTLHDGVAPNSALEPTTASLQGNFEADMESVEPPRATDELEIVFRADPTIWDGRFANISWLQELPDPLTKITWDTAALMSPATAERLDLANEDVVVLQFSGSTVQATVWTMPGHAQDSITVTFGYGQRFGLVAEDVDFDFNVYTIRRANAMWFASGVEVEKTGNSYSLSTVRYTDTMEETEAVKRASLATFIDNPEFAQDKKTPDVTLLPDVEYNGYSWGMSIDLTSCIGCNACMIACQMENNIPVVGKEGIARGRDMSWIRIDRYYIEHDDGELETFFQPVACVHCENAPCELVCPVQATIHDHEGLNNMVYNRCIGTRYCSANCPYGVRRFNFLPYTNDLPMAEEHRNPNVSVRHEGVMEKCSYCLQRINQARIDSGRENRPIADGEVIPACGSACPTQAIIFGDLNDSSTQVSQLKTQPHDYGLLAEHNTVPRTTYLARITNPNEALANPSEEA